MYTVFRIAELNQARTADVYGTIEFLSSFVEGQTAVKGI